MLKAMFAYTFDNAVNFCGIFFFFFAGTIFRENLYSGPQKLKPAIRKN